MKTFQIVSFDELAALCIEDMKSVTQSCRLSLDAQVRAYDLLDMILSEACGDALLKP